MNDPFEPQQRDFSAVFLVALAIALLAGIGSLFWSYSLSRRLTATQAALAEANRKNDRLATDLRATNARLHVAAEELGNSLGITQKQMDARAERIIAQQEAANQRLESEQQQTARQVSAVRTDVSSVKSDVGGVKSDVAKTQSDLAGAISQLQSIRGDLSDHTSLIARNHDELEILKHRGDRNYYEFTLTKGHRKPVGAVSLELKKTDAKHARFTLLIYSDDMRYEKKNRNVNEPLQFYSGKDHGLFEVVVNSIDNKNQITGYLSTPKTSPVPAGI